MSYDDLDDECTMRGGGPTATHENSGSLGRIDQYELTQELGGGGFGTVFLARDTISCTAVAVKGLPPIVKNSKEELENIRSNFAMVGKLTHTNIAKMLVLHPSKSVEYACEDVRQKLRVAPGDFLMVMEYAPGVTLSKWRQQFPDGRVPIPRAINIVRQVASALDYAHTRRIIHRDIKPANVMVETSEDGVETVRVLDFGLAAEIRSSMGRLSREIRDTSGTRPYMAPEQWKGERQGPATDQYALAAMFCELVVGEVPFASVFDCGDPAVMRLAVTTDAPAIPAIPADLPKCVRKALAVALAKKPEERFATCGEFAAALEGKKVSRRGAETQRKGCAGKVLAVLALAAVIGVGGLVYHQRQERRQAERSRLEAESSKGSIEKAGSVVAQPVEAKDAPQPTRKDVDAIYVEARVQMGACGRLDPSDGFKSRIEDCQKSFDFAGAQYDLGRWAEAALAFTNVVGECKTLIEQSIDRDKAKTAADVLADAIKNAQSAGAKEYAPVRFSSATDLAKRGRGEFDAFKFSDATATYASAKSQFDLAAKEAYQAKQEEARKKREAEEAVQREEAERRKHEAKETDGNKANASNKARIQVGVSKDSVTIKISANCQMEFIRNTKGGWIAKSPVSWREYVAVVGKAPVDVLSFDTPATNVSAEDCELFLQKLTRRARLPNSSELSNLKEMPSISREWCSNIDSVRDGVLATAYDFHLSRTFVFLKKSRNIALGFRVVLDE